jgi:SNF2 family DNA or RNA helicase
MCLFMQFVHRLHITCPSYNPDDDAQVVGRAYRGGQKKQVVVTRWIACDTEDQHALVRQVCRASQGAVLSAVDSNMLLGNPTL